MGKKKRPARGFGQPTAFTVATRLPPPSIGPQTSFTQAVTEAVTIAVTAIVTVDVDILLPFSDQEAHSAGGQNKATGKDYLEYKASIV